MARYAIVQDSDGLIQNVIVWDGVTQWSPPDGTTASLDANGEASIDGWHDGAGFHPIMPAIGSILPVSGSVAGSTTVAIQGLNLDYGTVTVKFDGSAATNVANRTKTSLQCDTPAHAVGQVNVTVENESGSWTGQSQLTNGFEYTP